MIDKKFKSWLLKNGMANKSTNDVLSRCRRVERVLGLSLFSHVKNTEGAEKIAEAVKANRAKFLGSKPKSYSAISVIIRAVRLYGEYRQSK